MSLGGKTTATQKIDPTLEAAGRAYLDMVRSIGQLGFVPYKGASVAGMQPGQIAAMQNNNAGMAAFGLNTAAVPTAGDLSAYPIYQEQLAAMDPGQRAFIESLFINPITGAAPTRSFGPESYSAAPQNTAGTSSQRSSGSSSGSTASSGTPTTGYVSLRDMIDGGGAGASGSTFSGGWLSNLLNKSGINPVDGRSAPSNATRR